MTDSSRKIILFFLLLPSFLLSSCAKPGGDASGGVTLTIVDYFVTDRSKGLGITALTSDEVLGNLLLEPLCYDEDAPVFKTEDVLVRDTFHSDGGMKWQIRLRDGVRFHDGTLLTAADIVYSFQELVKSGNTLKSIKSLKVKDDISLDMELYNPSDLIDIPLNSIFALSRASTPRKPLGTGPFKFGRWLDNGLELMANDKYHEGRPRIDKVRLIYEPDERARLQKLLAGDADLMPGVSPYIADFVRKDSRFYLNPLTAPYHVSLFLNNESPFFKDREVRLALNMAVNRGRILDILKGGGVPASGPFSQESLPAGAAIPPYKYAPKESVRLLKEAGWHGRKGDGVLEKDGKRFAFTIFYMPDVDEYKKVADMIARDLFEVGIEARAAAVQYDTLTDRYVRTEEYDAVLDLQQSSSAPNMADRWQTPSLHTGKSGNISRYSSKEVDRLLDAAQASSDREDKRRIYARVQRVLHDDAPAVFLYHPVYFSAVSKRFKEGEEFMGTPYSWHKIKDWTLR